MMRSLNFPPRRARTSCSVLALATVLVVGASPALAVGSFQGNGVVFSGTGSISTGASTTNITVSTPQTVIDWAPFDTGTGGGTINFQPSGTTASFSGPSAFAVLNRINPADSSRAIGLNGTIQVTALGIGGAGNGSIYFYSPGGFVLGSTARINVGSLVLSASPITVTGGSFINGASNTVVFGQATQAGAAITTIAGSQIVASAPDAYVAMVAPRVTHEGSINVSGSAALVGAEAATINFAPSGLFDIQVTAGTTDATGVASTGTITGAASTGAADIHRAYLVAVPKNSALTMLISNGGSLGFDVAGAANVVGNTVVLSAGHDISSGSIAGVSSGQGASALGNIDLRDSSITSALNSESTGFSHFSGFSALHFYSNVSSHADGEIWFSSQTNSGTVDVDGNLSLSTVRYGGNGQAAAASGINLYNIVGGGRLTVQGATSLDSSAYGGWSSTSGINGGAGTAGNIGINSDGNGTVALLGGLTANAIGAGGSAGGAGVNGGAGHGGNVSIYTAGENSRLTVTGATTINANGYGGSGNGGECFSCNGAGGDGTGGTVQISPSDSATTGAVMTFNGNVTASANGYGGTAVTGAAGKGLGGAAGLLSANLSTVNVNGALSLQALGQGGYNQTSTGGEGRGGNAYISSFGTATSGQLSISGNVSLDVDGTGGGTGGDGATAGQATGGNAFILAARDGVTISGTADLSATGLGGTAALGAGGTGLGGNAYIDSEKTLSIGGLATLSTGGTGGSGKTGGAGRGGSASVYTNAAGATLTVGGVNASAQGTGGNATANLGGIGNGGDVRIYYSGGSTLTVNGDASLAADGQGGASISGNGAEGRGGYTKIGATAAGGAGGTLTITGNANLVARGFGGDTNGVGAIGGAGTGGTVDTGGSFGTMNINGSLFGSVLGLGGYAGSGTGGSGYGGDALLDASGATVTVGSAELNANADGGDGGMGGYGEAGYAALLSSSSLTVLGDATVRANAQGGLGTAGNGGNGLAGFSYVRASNGTLTVGGNTNVRAGASGGSTQSASSTAGNGQGGDSVVRAESGGTVTLNGTLTGKAIGVGGDLLSDANGGDGHGGNVSVEASAANAHVIVKGAVLLDASGFASSGECTTCGISGGDGLGGQVSAESLIAPTASLDFQSSLTLIADAYGGSGNGGPSGDGHGGTALAQSSAGSHISVGGDASLSSNGFGGASYVSTDGIGGNGIGGTGQIETFNTGGVGGNISIAGSAFVHADGTGGDASVGANPHGGDGTGGNARIITTLGTITIGTSQSGGNATVTADGFGGYSAGGTGGNGFGGLIAGILAMNGNINIAGFASVSGSGFGGDGLTGGDGFGSDVDSVDGQTLGDGAQIFARNGNIVIDGGASVAATGTGGDGGYNNGSGGTYGGDGGNGSGGYARIIAQNGDLGPSSITIIGGAREGSGTASVNVDGTGGSGGNGGSGNVGGNGGNGGSGAAGGGLIAATAGNGTITIDNAQGYARGTGGVGGNGGNGDGAAGGNGGRGGNGVGGSIAIGTVSGGNDQALNINNGVGNYGTVVANANAVGGTGGAGNFGATNGNGGNGGDAIDGSATLLVRGSTVNVGSASLTANATGGNAGFGYVSQGGTPGVTGVGGNATVGGNGGIGVLVTGRYLIPAQRGTLNAGTISGTAIATSGIGIPNGLSKSLGGSGVSFLNADGNIGSLDFLIGLGSNPSASGVDSISVINGNVQVKNGFSFVTRGNLSLFANNGDMHAGSLTLDAGNFVFDPVNDPPSNRGTYFADTATITTHYNFVTSANLDIGGNLVIDAPRLINAQKFTIGGDLSLFAHNGGITATIFNVAGRADFNAAASIQIGTVNAGFFHADAGGAFTAPDVTSDTNIQVHSGGNMTLGNLVAGLNVDSGGNKAIRLDSGGSILMGNAIAKDGIDFSAKGTVTGGNLTSGLSVGGDADGAIVLGNISAGFVNPQGVPEKNFSVGMGSKTSITTGNIDSKYSVGFATLGPITTGTINAGADLLAMASGNMLFGPVTAGGRVYLADSSMFTAAGGDADFNPELVFAATPVASAGSITVNGAIAAGSLQAAAGTSFNSGNIGAHGLISVAAGTTITTGSIHNTNDTFLDAGSAISVGAIDSGAGAVSLTAGSFIGGSLVQAGSIYGESGDSITLGNLTASGNIELLAGTDILVGNVMAGQSIDLNAHSNVHGGNLTAGDTVESKAGGLIDLAAVSAGLVNRSTSEGAEYNVGLQAGTTIHTDNIAAAANIGLAALGNIATGNINAGAGFLALGGGNMRFGSIDAREIAYLANYSMLALGGDFETGFNPLAIISQTPVNSGGSIIIGGPVTAGTFYAAAGTLFDPVNITSGHNIFIEAGTDIIVGDLVAGTSDGTIDSRAIHLDAGGSISLGNAIAAGSIKLDAVGAITGGNITSGSSIQADAGAAVKLGSLSSGLVNPQPPSGTDISVGIKSKTSIQLGNVDSAGTVGLLSLGAIAAGNIHAAGDLIALAAGDMTLGGLNVGGQALLSNPSLYTAAQDANGDADPAAILASAVMPSGGSITTGSIAAGNLRASAGTTLTVGTITTVGSTALTSGGNMTAQTVHSGTSLLMTSGGTLDAGELTAGTSVRLSGTGAINVGAIHAGTGIGAASVGPGSPVEIFSNASIRTGNIGTNGYVGLYTPHDLTTGSIDAAHDVIALVGDNASFGAVHTPERFFLGGYSMFSALNGGESFTPAAVFGATKAATGGSATLADSSSVGTFQAFVGHDTTIQSLQTSGGALIDTGGMFTLNGTLAGASRIVSNDITIGGSAAVNGGYLHLVSRNGAQTVIGDGVSGGGYQLSNAEANLIHTDFSVIADTTYGAAAKMLIGNLAIAPAASDQAARNYEFATANGSSSTSVGTVKVIGDVTFTGLGVADHVNLRGNLVEVDAATGSVNLFGQGTTLGGVLGLYAPKVWVASGDILTKLEANPLYSGRVTDLNQPAAVQRPAGVLRAASFDIDAGSENFQSLLVQNTGTKALPAGFLVNQTIGDGQGGGEAAGSIDLVINGQLVTDAGTQTGVAVRDLLITQFGPERFIAGSTINGCPLVGSCVAPPPQIDTVKPTDVQLTGSTGLGDGLFGNESDIVGEDSGGGGDASSPITPPIPLFDSRPLTQAGDVDDPVSGAGNPSLYGSPDQNDGNDDSDELQKKKKAKKGDGK